MKKVYGHLLWEVVLKDEDNDIDYENNGNELLDMDVVYDGEMNYLLRDFDEVGQDVFSYEDPDEDREKKNIIDYIRDHEIIGYKTHVEILV